MTPRAFDRRRTVRPLDWERRAVPAWWTRTGYDPQRGLRLPAAHQLELPLLRGPGSDSTVRTPV